MTDAASCPPAHVSVPFYIAANILPDGRICVWDGVAEIAVDGRSKGLQQRVNQAVRQLDAERAARTNQAARELRCPT